MSEELDPEIKRALAAVSLPVSSPAGARERVLARVKTTAALPQAEPSPDVASPDASSLASATTSGVLKLVTAFVVGVSAGAGGYHVLARQRADASAQPVVVAPAVVPETSDSSPVPSIAPEPVAPTPKARKRAASASGVATEVLPKTQDLALERDAQLASERALLQRARTALARLQAGDALAALHEHEARFAEGQLVEERAALEVSALVGLQRHDEARAAGRSFLTRYPKSFLRASVEHALSLIPQK